MSWKSIEKVAVLMVIFFCLVVFIFSLIKIINFHTCRKSANCPRNHLCLDRRCRPMSKSYLKLVHGKKGTVCWREDDCRDGLVCLDAKCQDYGKYLINHPTSKKVTK